MSSDSGLLSSDIRNTATAAGRRPLQLEEQFENLAQQHQAATTGMWIFLATEVMFFGTLFVGLGIYRYSYPDAFEKGSEHLNWMIGGINTLVLLVSSFTIVLAVHFARLGRRQALVRALGATAVLGTLFLVFKAVEYYLDYRESLIPGWKFDPRQWTERNGLAASEVPHVKLFLAFYWVMTLVHGLHVTIGIGAVLTMMALARSGRFTAEYYTPVDVTALYWHFVDIVWIFLLPSLYLLGTHDWSKNPF